MAAILVIVRVGRGRGLAGVVTRAVAVVSTSAPAAAAAASAATAIAVLAIAARFVMAPRRGLGLVGVVALGVVLILVDVVLDSLVGLVLGTVGDSRAGHGRRDGGRDLGHLDTVDGAFAVRQAVVDLDGDEQAGRRMQARQGVALVVQDVERHGGRGAQDDGAGPLAGFHLGGAHRQQRGRFRRADTAGAGAVFADVGHAFQQAHAAALAADLHQAELGDLAHLDPGAVAFERRGQHLLDGPVVLGLIHVDEVDDHQAGQVAQAHLAGGFLGGLKVGLEGRRLDVAFLGRLARVDVDRDQGLGLVDDQVTAGFQGNDRRLQLRQDVLDLVLDEERGRALVELDLLGQGRRQYAHEIAGLAPGVLALDLQALEILVEHVAHGAADEVLFLIDQGRRVRAERGLADVFPQAQQIFVVALDLGLGALGARRADDQAHALGHFQGRDSALQATTVRSVGDLARNAAALAGVGHQDAVAAGQRQAGGQGRALGATLFLDDLDQQDLPTADHFLDLVAAHQAAAQLGLVGGQAVVVLGFSLGLGLLFLGFRLGHDGFAVGDRDLVVVRMDFVEGEEAVTVSAVFDEGGLEAGLYARDLGQIDVAAKLFAIAAFEIEILNPAVVDDGDAGFFRVRRIDQHDFRHGRSGLRGAPKPGVHRGRGRLASTGG